MIVTAIEDYGKGKQKVYIDGQLAFVLYQGELSGCHIEEQKELPQEIYERILDEILWKRIRERCLYLLKSMDRTECQLRTNLRQNFYPEELIDRAVDWLKKLHYLDDTRYVENYLRCHAENKSRRVLFSELSQRGVDQALIKSAMEEMEAPDEESQIRKWVEKKHVNLAECSLKERQKLYGFLLRKGFSPSEIRKVLNEEEIL